MRNSRWVRLLAYVTGSVTRKFCCGTSIWPLRTGSCGPSAYAYHTYYYTPVYYRPVYVAPVVYPVYTYHYWYYKFAGR